MHPPRITPRYSAGITSGQRYRQHVDNSIIAADQDRKRHKPYQSRVKPRPMLIGESPTACTGGRTPFYLQIEIKSRYDARESDTRNDERRQNDKTNEPHKQPTKE